MVDCSVGFDDPLERTLLAAIASRQLDFRPNDPVSPRNLASRPLAGKVVYFQRETVVVRYTRSLVRTHLLPHLSGIPRAGKRIRCPPWDK